jgi:7-carboxy-7-deazaguanine synthase
MDLKCPGRRHVRTEPVVQSGPADPARDEVKFVLADRADYEWSRGVIRDYTLEKRCRRCCCRRFPRALRLEDLAAWMLEDALPARLQLQRTKSSCRPTGASVIPVKMRIVKTVYF